ncbi:3-dehydroquinate synthase [Desulfopila aestuarii]|uniref:3-dehydroquinate synthase n=1 Tax=Desulfopila aestuarii DSM 18488 TaxID=1121416 RepID=A0A1M7Y1J6_9BACT|nr:3-dehydroquinate synthase [Desulfopila aestuarii]SHO45671.1 3-dehydroquinate synthase [Desulfopila aestuarii DSM 18488]
MAEVQVGLGSRSYPIYVEQGCLERIGNDLARRNIGNRYAIITDTNVNSLYGEKLLEMLLSVGLKAKLFPFPAGEKSKTLFTVEALASRLALAGFDRHDAVIALGGGVTGDLAGFLASAYMRGIPFVQVPTTLLAQVDSSVGGKTGVDLPEGKNLFGAFYQPKAVYIDSNVLNTLPKEELLGGLAEVIKYGVIRDSEFFTFLEEYRRKILQLDQSVIQKLICRCCEIKAEVVAADEHEGGLRKILNFGHTIGHAIEGASNYQLIHGLAVAIGMVAASRLSVIKDTLSGKEAERIYSVISAYGMPVSVPSYLDRQQVKRYLQTDKKAVKGKVFYILPDAIGSTYITDEVSEEMVDTVLLAER